MSQLAEEGWHIMNDDCLQLALARQELRIQLQPNAILRNGDEICLLYAYFRQRPQISTDGVRALFSLVRTCLDVNHREKVKIVVLDCYKDESYEDCDFHVGEKWITDKVENVITRYVVAYRASLDGSPPQQPPPSGGLPSSVDPPQVLYGSTTLAVDDQLMLQLT